MTLLQALRQLFVHYPQNVLWHETTPSPYGELIRRSSKGHEPQSTV